MIEEEEPEEEAKKETRKNMIQKMRELSNDTKAGPEEAKNS